MYKPKVSVVMETITAREDAADQPICEKLAGAVNALDGQTYHRELIELIIVLDREIDAKDAREIFNRYPAAKFISSLTSNYFAAKNAGVAAATGKIVALLDSDCVPEPDWLEMLVSRFANGVSAVGGATRYAGESLGARTFSVPHFAYILAEENGRASGFNIHNVAFRREVILSHPFDSRIRRDGGCYLLFHQLLADGAVIVHERHAVTHHSPDFAGLGFARKHFKRGYDGVSVYAFDERAVLRGTVWFRRFGPLALVAITGRRILRDWARMLRHHRQISIPILALPYFFVIAVATRSIELVGGTVAFVKRRKTGRVS